MLCLDSFAGKIITCRCEKNPIHRHNIVIDLLLQELFKYSTLAGTVIVNQNEKSKYVVQALLGPFPQAW